MEYVNFSSDEDDDWIDEMELDSEFIPSESEEEESTSDEDISSSTCVKGVKRKSYEDDVLISSTTNKGIDKDLVENSDSDVSEEIPYLPPLGPLCNPQSNENDASSSESDSDIDIVEEEIIRDITYPSIFIRKIISSKTTKSGKFKKSDRVYNTRHFCPFCYKSVSNFIQHLNSKAHSKETEVVNLKALVGKERQKNISMLRNKGDHLQNEKTISKKRGEMVLARRIGSNENFNSLNYGPCPLCLEWLKLDTLYRHQNKCCALSADSSSFTSKGNIMVQSAMIAGRLKETACKSLVNEVFPIMQEDKIGQVAKNDNLILALGNHWHKRNIGNKLMRKHYVSAVMRLTSRLLIETRKITQSEQRLEYYLQPRYFSEVAHAALKVAKQDDDNDENLQAPSNAIKLGYHLKRLCNLKLGLAIRQGNDDQRRASKNFLKLMELEWCSKLARVNLEERRRNKKVELPLPSDVKKLSDYLKTELESFDKGNLTYENFKKGSTLTEAVLITYNRRRPGEIQAMRLVDYHNRKTGIDPGVGGEIVKSLSEFERKLVEEQDVIEIRGKCGKCVPVIIPKYVRGVLAHLCNQSVRAAAGIPSSSVYIFATNRAGVVRGYDSVQFVTQNADLQFPERIRGTNMRRLMATLCQALDVTPQQQKWIIDHMGHTLDVHNIHYRCTSDIIERSDIAKLLMLMDRKQVGYFKNKRLEEISLEELIEEPDEANDTVDENDDRFLNTDDGERQEEEEFIPNLLEDEEEEIPVKSRKKKKASFTRKKWTVAEEEEINKRFAGFLARDKCPGQKDVEKVMAQSKKCGGLLHARPRDNIKKKVSCMLVKARKNNNDL
ncbi:uncharacterized protein LOC134236887 [Saccostrea cucullata]|uniref:uncharacterized protein LOC134236887 n=1 Tax=Saccostrea cuccullata TaxID=36930 RepID=UPI002ED67A92